MVMIDWDAMPPRARKVRAAMMAIERRGEQPSPGRIQRELGDTVTHNLNGRDCHVYTATMKDLGYTSIYSGPSARWVKK